MSEQDYRFITAKANMGRTIGLWEEQPENIENDLLHQWGVKTFTPPPDPKEKGEKIKVSVEKVEAKRKIIIRRRKK